MPKPIGPTRPSGSRSSRQAKAEALAKKARVHDRYVQKTYGLAPGEYQRRFDQQGGRCAICRRRSSRRLVVDHSHITGNVRALLCWRCNRDVVGPIDGSLERIDAAITFFQEMRHDLATNTPKEALPDPLVAADSPEDEGLHL